MLTYLELLHKLLQVNLHGGVKLGLNNCWQLNEALQCPNQSFPAIHVAGSNGKGSVVTKIATALQATGLKVGIYTSPHISSFRERIKINGQMISEEQVVRLLTQIFSIISKQSIPATFFEITTLLALKHFSDEKVDIAVIETGLGGRLDATNIVSSKLSIITSISLEHTELLGNTLEEIAYEKAGIIRPNVPILIGPRVPVKLVEDIAKKNNSPFSKLSGTFKDFHAENEAIAKQALKLLDVPTAAIELGLQALPPCRLEIFYPATLPVSYCSPNLKAIILDVAHNPDGLKHLLEAINNRFPKIPLRFIIGISQNKDILACLQVIKDVASHFHLVEASNGRAAPKELLQQELLNLGVVPTKISCETSMQLALNAASKSVRTEEEIIVICGTFFIMADAREALGIKEPRDPDDLNERLKHL